MNFFFWNIEVICDSKMYFDRVDFFFCFFKVVLNKFEGGNSILKVVNYVDI